MPRRKPKMLDNHEELVAFEQLSYALPIDVVFRMSNTVEDHLILFMVYRVRYEDPDMSTLRWACSTDGGYPSGGIIE